MRTSDSDIDRLVAELRKDREAMQHLRLGQWLIGAAARVDLFYLENSELFTRLAAFRRANEMLPLTTKQEST